MQLAGCYDHPIKINKSIIIFYNIMFITSVHVQHAVPAAGLSFKLIIYFNTYCSMYGRPHSLQLICSSEGDLARYRITVIAGLVV